MAATPSPRLLVARGPRLTEALLLEEVERRLDTAEADPALLARPLRLVVPSASLRRHLGAEITRRRGRGVAGLTIQTHYHLALEILERSGRPARPGRRLADLLPERLARRQPSLAEPLEGLVDGYAAVAATVRDLLDARLEPALLDGVLEALEEDGSQVASRGEVVRARALARVAVETWRRVEESGLGHTSRLLVEAAELLEAGGPELLPARGVLLHGYADATGTVTDLLQALQRHLGAWTYLDRPPDPRPPGGDGGEADGAAGADDDAPRQRPPRPGPGRRHPAEAVPGPAGRFGERFVERLSQAALPEAVQPGGTAVPDHPPSPPACFQARGAEGEAREVARRVARLLAGGARPEGIALVARDPAPYARPLRHHLEALGVPFSAPGQAGAPTPEDRRLGALLDLLRRGRRTPAERWLEALGEPPGKPSSPGGAELRPSFGLQPSFELRLGLAALGAGRLEDVARLDLQPVLGNRPSLPLPLRSGLGEEAADEDGPLPAGPGDDEEDEEGEGPEDGAAPPGRDLRAPRRRLARSVLEAAVEAARRLLERLESWPEVSLAEHRGILEALLHEDLLWRPGAPGESPERGAEPPPRRRVLAALELLAEEGPGGFLVSPDELHRLLARVLSERAPGRSGSRLGGRGGGVQVLSVTEARARTFEHLFVLGLNRGVFPRPVREDPLLQDDLRRVLERLLPDVPVKAVGFDEERYLFAQLLAAAPSVTLSWQSSDDSGDPRSPSPLVERLAPGRAPLAPSPWTSWTGAARDGGARDGGARDGEGGGSGDRDGGAGNGARPVLETLTRAALHRPRRVLEALLPVALEESRRRSRELLGLPGGVPGAAGSGPDRLAAARLAVLDEIDPDRSTPEGRRAARRLGPFFGFIGRPGEADPRHRDLWVTTLERTAGCPWQVLLTRLLGLEPSPDPLQALPGLDPLLLGRVVHGVLERVVREHAPWPEPGDDRNAAPELAELLDREPVRPPWPAPDRLREWCEEQAATVLRQEGVGLPGLARALARAALPYLEAARGADWAGGPPPVLGVEALGHARVTDRKGRARPLHFRADRVDRMVGGAAGAGLRLTDYKTGRPVSEAKREDTRRRHLLARAEEGRRLQAAAYGRAELLGAAEEEIGVEGRYLFLKPEAEQRQHAVAGGDPDFSRALDQVARAVLGVWDTGAFFPRVVDPEGRREPRRCSWCPVAEACIRGDSGARLRLAQWARRGTEPGRARPGAPELTGDPEAEEALLDVWWLAGERPGEGS